MPKYDVLRRHDGDKEYHEGDERTLSKGEALHLVDLGVLRLQGEDDEADDQAEKAEAATENKMEASPTNKVERPARRKAEG